MSRSALNHAAFWLVVGARSSPARSSASNAVASRHPFVRREKAPERPRQVCKDALDILLVGLARQRRAVPRRRTPAGVMRASSRLSHSVTQALPRVSGSGSASM